MQNSEFLVAIIAIVISVVGAIATIFSIRIAFLSFKRTTTLQTEIFILGAYKDYMDMMYSDVGEQQQQNAQTRFLMAIDLYCKYVINGHLDQKLSNDNLHFYEECIIVFKDTIQKDIENYNNIADYAKRYKISLN